MFWFDRTAIHRLLTVYLWVFHIYIYIYILRIHYIRFSMVGRCLRLLVDYSFSRPLEMLPNDQYLMQPLLRKSYTLLATKMFPKKC